MGQQIRVKRQGISEMEIDQAVAIQRREIGEGFLSSLGNTALRLIFSVIAESDRGVMVVAEDTSGGGVCGFVCGATDTGAVYRDFLRKKSLEAAFYVGPRLLTPARLRRALETLFYPARKRERQEETAALPEAELLSIAVDRNYQGQGVAPLLFQELAAALAEKGRSAFKIVAGEKLARAHGFYEKMGAKRAATVEVHAGEKSLVYVYETRSEPAFDERGQVG